jgi:hypothetical protein
MRYELEIFGHYVADNASICLAQCPEKLHAMFDQFKIGCGADHERLAVIDDIEVMARGLAGETSHRCEVQPVERPAETSLRSEVSRKRKVTLAAALKAAAKVGRNVSGAVIEDGKIELKFGEPGAGDDAADELSKWRKRRASHSQGH